MLSGGRIVFEDEEKFIEKWIWGDWIIWLEGNEKYVLNIVKLIEFIDSLVILCGEILDGLNGYCI